MTFAHIIGQRYMFSMSDSEDTDLDLGLEPSDKFDSDESNEGDEAGIEGN